MCLSCVKRDLPSSHPPCRLSLPTSISGSSSSLSAELLSAHGRFMTHGAPARPAAVCPRGGESEPQKKVSSESPLSVCYRSIINTDQQLLRDPAAGAPGSSRDAPDQSVSSLLRGPVRRSVPRRASGKRSGAGGLCGGCRAHC